MCLALAYTGGKAVYTSAHHVSEPGVSMAEGTTGKGAFLHGE